MKLHTVGGAPNVRKVEAVIRHLGLSVDIQKHGIADIGAADYLAINPNGMVPTLEDGSFRLWESNAIIQYLADKAGDTALFPRDPAARADVARWQFWEAVHFNRAFGALAFETVAKAVLNRGPADPAIVAQAQADLARFAPVLERHLAGRTYLVGDGLTLADYSMTTFESYRSKAPFDWSGFPNVNAYLDRMRETEAWVGAAAEPRSLVVA